MLSILMLQFAFTFRESTMTEEVAIKDYQGLIEVVKLHSQKLNCIELIKCRVLEKTEYTFESQVSIFNKTLIVQEVIFCEDDFDRLLKVIFSQRQFAELHIRELKPKLSLRLSETVGEFLATDDHLRSLHLPMNWLTNVDVQAIAKCFKTNKTLAELYLPNNNIDESGLTDIYHALPPESMNLLTLDVSSNPCKGEVIHHLENLIPDFIHTYDDEDEDDD